ncbi:phage terminase small subunit [Variovorax sp. CY25R-8]|uniref:phage terminase small subunit n=1 Tax=Variovorax sp. CY25R-8 TaxID=2855501 RepID=UPI0021BAC982|nr:phage terminase small subunit [Variovorax sp. CY25R-8]MCT8178144.1 small terminase subunit [Variovorax sp. CY25R-8]
MRPLSPAQRHRARILQEQAQAASPYGVELQGDAYGLMRVKLSQDKGRLSQIQSHERRAEMKARLLPEYFDWIGTSLATGNGAQDQVLTTVMVWAFDAGAYALGLEIAGYVIRHRMPMADDYKRSPAAIVIDELANAYLKGQWSPLIVQIGDNGARQLGAAAAGDAPGQARAQAAALLIEAEALTAEQDAPDQARAKLHKAIAYAALGKVQTAEDPDLAAIEPEALQVAAARLQRALELDSNSGVKKDIERIERALAKADKASTAEIAPAAAAPAARDTEQPATPPPGAARKGTPAAKKASAARKRASGK